MSRRSAKFAGFWLSLLVAPIAWSTLPGSQARVAGYGPEASYYLVTDIDAGIVVNRQQTLAFLSRHAALETPVGYQIKDVEDEIARNQKQLKKLVKAGRIIPVPYNTLLTTLELLPGESSKTVHYQIFSDDDIGYGRDYTGSVIKVRVDDGSAKGRELYATWLAPRDSVVVSDRAWLRTSSLKTIPGTTNADLMFRYVQAVIAKDERGAFAAARRGQMKYVPTDTECTVTAIDHERRLTQVRVLVDGESLQLWVPRSMVSLLPAAAPPVPTP